MNTTYLPLQSIIIFFFFIPLLLLSSISALNLDGITLLSFKQTLLPHQSPLLQNWNQSHPTPCSWSGVTCAPQNGPVTALSLPNSHLTGSIPITALSRLRHLQLLNLSNNSINGTIPASIFNFPNLQTLSLSSNFISGQLPETIPALQSLQVLNLSNNNISGFVLRNFAENIPVNAVVDLSFNNLTGEIPQMFSNQKQEYFAGNLNLCGKPLNKACTVPSLHSFPPNVSLNGSATAAIAAMPKTTGDEDTLVNHSHRKVNSWKIVAILAGDVAGMMTLVILFYTYQFRKKNTSQNRTDELVEVKADEARACCCFVRGSEEEERETLTDNETEGDDERRLVMVDRETEMEMETLLKASAYVLGSSGGSIVYKAVVGGGGGGGGGVFVVRRIGECGVEKMKDFEKIVRGLSKFRHRNLVKVLGFYWGEEEKLVIYDYVSNGNLATAGYEKTGSSSCHLSFETRLKIAKGIAKGLSYIHEKKHVHGNMKPNNILLTPNMDPVISDFGLDWLILGKANSAIHKSSSTQEEPTIITRNHHYHHTNNLYGYVSPYQAPESIKSSKSNPKWDVYSFGIILLELFLGKVFSYNELAQWNTDSTTANMETKILKIADQFISTIDEHGSRKDCFLTCTKLGFSCASLVPHKRPSMKVVLQVIEKIQCTS
ncbi:hypothetical protein QVD17_05774 [Tagetes erecta]|uniref:Protein kinase domain-containing protein n=1 Tax=Tagetes erecta TaxID=13708 RepID=A0AAD8LCM4_TARER|nr:hypothetical protein QVD17_05774 [Tagetes erecta]